MFGHLDIATYSKPLTNGLAQVDGEYYTILCCYSLRFMSSNSCARDSSAGVAPVTASASAAAGVLLVVFTDKPEPSAMILPVWT